MALGLSADAFILVENLDHRRFMWGSTFDLDRIKLLLLWGTAHGGDASVVGDPRKVFDIADGYVTGGLPMLVGMVREGDLSPTRTLVRALGEQIKSKFIDAE